MVCEGTLGVPACQVGCASGVSDTRKVFVAQTQTQQTGRAGLGPCCLFAHIHFQLTLAEQL